MALDFTAIDFETANGFRGSPCAVGLVKVRGGRPVETATWLMRPPAGHDRFDPRNVAIHGIHPEEVADRPRFGELFSEIGGFIGDDVLAAHNAAFDLGVIRSALEVSDLPAPAYDYACTVVLSRRTYDLPSHSLPFVAEAAGVPLVNHHDATEDAAACAGILVDIAQRHGADSVEELYDALHLTLPHHPEFVPGRDAVSTPTAKALRATVGAATVGGATGGGGIRTTAERAVRGPRTWAPWPEEGVNPSANAAADPAHPLFGHRIVFTGALGMTRAEAKGRAAALGAQPASSVTRATTLLVVGDGFVAADLVAGRGTGRMTSKARRALELRSSGFRVEVLSEGEFLQMLGGEWPAKSA
ncbi:exonuclease domain-containing protein [Sinomonas sp. ASV322]|uniref:exonuclease domain-containing protein n=1 Tax=Sinomonas sp. ASV322 TaxID=3041920 RepID=UPI0027DB82F5|nr:exonuclease domain-containing protein [Sinomonas sp. ASV322]MDQ4502092.1 exonuclease domain-containing protein [Sinomonas sp. ASV322]